MNPVLKAFHQIVDELELGNVPYMVMGGWAVQVWGRPRPTYDVDFTLSVSSEGLRAFLGALAQKGATVDEAFLKGFEDNLGRFAKCASFRL